MKKTCNLIGQIFFPLIITCLFLFNTGCGLDTFYVIDAPNAIYHQPEYTNEIQFDQKYFEFGTNETNSIEGFDFEGTEVYYKIYNTSSQMTSEVSSLQSLANDAEKSVNAAEKMITATNSDGSGGYGYKQLRVDGRYESPLIPYTGSNKRILIRLTDYQDVEKYSARICIVNGNNDESYLYGSSTKTIPVRDVNRKSFNFGRNGDKDSVPLSTGEDDVKYVKDSGSDLWYVAMFAVAVGKDSTYVQYRSNILYLGSVRIDSSSFDN